MKAYNKLPKADGFDLGNSNKEINNKSFMSSYEYSTTGFSVGCYLNSGNSFSVKRKHNPYFKATHSKSVDNDPSVYRVTYQAIYASSGEVRMGVPFLGPISDLKVDMKMNETDRFIFYIAGDGTNTYVASGKLYYGG